MTLGLFSISILLVFLFGSFVRQYGCIGYGLGRAGIGITAASTLLLALLIFAICLK
ncbi:MAG: DUF3309 domain-containing protein [Ponticaulis sp.]|nr:DUF3309 domain-containing protein [Ponticaulis sp.]